MFIELSIHSLCRSQDEYERTVASNNVLSINISDRNPANWKKKKNTHRNENIISSHFQVLDKIGVVRRKQTARCHRLPEEEEINSLYQFSLTMPPHRQRVWSTPTTYKCKFSRIEHAARRQVILSIWLHYRLPKSGRPITIYRPFEPPSEWFQVLHITHTPPLRLSICRSLFFFFCFCFCFDSARRRNNEFSKFIFNGKISSASSLDAVAVSLDQFTPNRNVQHSSTWWISN